MEICTKTEENKEICSETFECALKMWQKYVKYANINTVHFL